MMVGPVDYGGQDDFRAGDVTSDMVLDDPDELLAEVTIMFRRADGYAPQSGNWKACGCQCPLPKNDRPCHSNSIVVDQNQRIWTWNVFNMPS